MPVPVTVTEDNTGRPKAIRTPRRTAVTCVINRWRIDDEWWRSDTSVISRLYYTVLLASGQRLVLYKDLSTGDWYRQTH
jgi:hypothetical protein